jgi:formylglycine-generating enzyme required for sulfatase activity
MVLVVPDSRIPEGSKLGGFLIRVHEVTNREFMQFLSSPEGAHWGKEKFRDHDVKDHSETPYYGLSNQYHLFLWQEGKIIPGMESHPVAWISWYCAAAYCNWLTLQDLSKADVYYEFVRNDATAVEWTVRPFPDTRRGYRLPESREWEYSARSGKYSKSGQEIEFPWEVFDDPGKGAICKRLMDARGDATEPVLSDVLNDFGISGQMGNVREWCNDSPEEDPSKRLILGSTMTWGLDSMKFRQRFAIYPYNTNPDVGFRVARSLSARETEEIKRLLSNKGA